MDALYILGNGSEADDKEILYSIRSLAEHMLDLRNIYVIGKMPLDLPGVIHVEADDPYPEKWRNAHHKILLACDIPDLSDDFLLMNDDFFMLESFNGIDFPFYALKDSSGGSCGLNSFQVHCPIRLNKAMYKSLPFSLDQTACKSPRTFFANFFKAPPTFVSDFVISVDPKLPDLDSQIKNLPCFSISNSTMLIPEFSDWLFDLYSHPSRFELSDEN